MVFAILNLFDVQYRTAKKRWIALSVVEEYLPVHEGSRYFEGKRPEAACEGVCFAWNGRDERQSAGRVFDEVYGWHVWVGFSRWVVLAVGVEFCRGPGCIAVLAVVVVLAFLDVDSNAFDSFRLGQHFSSVVARNVFSLDVFRLLPGVEQF
jgi:hypothetical protein